MLTLMRCRTPAPDLSRLACGTAARLLGRSATAIVAAAFALNGCAWLPTGEPPPSRPDADAPAWVGACLYVFDRFDTLVAEGGVRDAGAYPLPSFPYLRSDRALAALGDTLPAERMPEWLARLAERDATARRYEAANYPQAQPALPPLDDLDGCRDRLLRERLADHPARWSEVLAEATPPPVYWQWQRRVGVYRLTSRVVGAAVTRLHAEETPYFEDAAASWRGGLPLRDYIPVPAPALMQIPVPRDALGLPAYGPSTLARLFEAHAPIWRIVEGHSADHPGTPFWREDGTVAVDTTRPVMYTATGMTRIDGVWLPQLLYSIWFPERVSEGPLDTSAGWLDGLTFRVTLGDDGRPLVYDIMHNCGCYHMFFTPEDWRLRVDAPGETVWVPAAKPPLPAHTRIALTVASGTHYVRGITALPEPPSGRTMPLADYDVLRSLPLPGDGRRSMFGPDGVVPGTERAERFLLWPMGVPSPGAMRQLGRHATAFVGERHFDDPDLFERLFEIPGIAAQ